jgi:hypothetical protein
LVEYASFLTINSIYVEWVPYNKICKINHLLFSFLKYLLDPGRVVT